MTEASFARPASPAIAVVGMACELPDAHSPAELWENVLAGRQAFRRIPAERLSLADYHSDDRRAPDSIYSTRAAVLEGWEFDRVRFRVAGATWRAADPAHWLALDVSSRALADAGFASGDGLPRETTGVVVGNTLTGEVSRAQLLRLRWPYVRRTVAARLLAAGWSEERCTAFLADLETHYKAPFPEPMEETLAGGLSNTIAGRIANHFDLGGGGFTVDGACSSSLLAAAQAAAALAAGDLDVALAGGVDLSLDPFELVGFARTGALAAGPMRVYDTRSDGFIPGEGCGFVVLMRHTDAVAQGRRVYAVVRGWGISSDGSGGITRPEVEGQRRALARAYRRAGFGIETVGYFEGHGTGTAVGDATELEALTAARRAADPDAPPAAVGSVKANLGHTKAAAGVAALIKAAMAVHTQVLPPTTGCEQPHPLLAGERPALTALGRGRLWPREIPLRAGVSSMGFGGINAHLALEGPARERRRRLSATERGRLASAQDAELVLLAASDRRSLAAKLERLAELAPRISHGELTDLAAETAREAGRSTPGGGARAALVAADPEELAAAVEILRSWLAEAAPGAGGPRGNGGPSPVRRLDPRRGIFLGSGAAPAGIGLLFPGQGSPVDVTAGRLGGALARRFEEAEEVWQRARLETAAASAGEPLSTAVAQPALVTASLAGLAVLRRLGLEAAVAVGHSLGELTALGWAGCLGEDALVELARVRGRAMAELGEADGAMASLGAPAETVEELLAGTAGKGAAAPGREVVISGSNSPRQTVVSGGAEAVEEVLSAARARGIAATRLPVSHAFHSPLVAAAVPALAAHLESLELAPPAAPVASTITGGLLEPGQDLRALLTAQITSPVRFEDAVAAVAGRVDLWLEVGPGRVLAGLVEEAGGAPVVALDAGGPSLRGLLAAAGAAFCLGHPVDAAALFEGRLTRPFPLDRELRFLANPCERAPRPVLGEGPARRRPEAPAVPSWTSAEETAGVSAEGEGSKVSGGETALDLVRRLVAARTELPPETLRPDSRMLSDLHLNSISVGQMVAEAARGLGLAAPASPTDYANATLAEVARVLEEQGELGAAGARREPEGPPAGIAAWVRPFTVELEDAPAPHSSGRREERGEGGPGTWRLVAPPDHPLRGALERALPATGCGGVALLLPPRPDERQVGLLLAAAREVLGGGPEGTPGGKLDELDERDKILVVQQGGGGGGFARTLQLEQPRRSVRVVDVPFNHPRAAEWVAAEAVLEGWGEAHYDWEGRRRRPVLQPLEPAPGGREGELPLGADDVLLVTGGGRGIAAECALALARASGARLALVGRSRPELDAELAANLERLEAHGVCAAYFAADVTDGSALAAAVTAAESELGPVTAVLHGAGVNHPRLLAELGETDFLATLAPKVLGLRHLLAAVDPHRLRLLATFGSIIARLGMPGEADYAVANEWMTLATEHFAREHPHCRCLAVEWSVWSGVGMGERLGRLEALARAGVSAIPPDVGVEQLVELVSRPQLAVAVVVSGRFGEPPTLGLPARELPFLRFLDRPRVHYPGIELIVDVEVSGDSDPYLADHVFRGERLLPAVLGLEAMAQVAAAVTGTAVPPVFEDVELPRPVVVPEGETVELRVASLVRRDGRVEVALRSATTGFAVDHFRAVCDFAPRRADPRRRAEIEPAPAPVPLVPDTDLYGGLLFQQGRFRRLAGYRELQATASLAEIAADGAVTWFARHLPGDLVLGDPAARDATLHGIQPSVPHATLLPLGVERLWAGELAATEPWLVAARERRREGDLFVYDVEILGTDGRVAERWEGLRLKAVERHPPPAAWRVPLLGPYLERRLQELVPGAAPKILVERRAGGPGAARTEASDRVLRRLVGAAAAAPGVHRRPDGKPEVPGGPRVSLAHAGDLVLAVAGEGPLGCDLEPVEPRPEATWRDLLGPERLRLAEEIAAVDGGGRDAAATRVWTAVECLKKAGALSDAPLIWVPPEVAGSSPGEPEDGWLLLRSGELTIGTLVASVERPGASLAVAVLLRPAAREAAVRVG